MENAYVYSFKQFVSASSTDIYCPTFVENIKNDSRIITNMMYYISSTDKITLYFENQLSAEEETVINEIVSLYNLTYTIYDEIQSIQNNCTTQGISIQSFGTSKLYNGNATIQVVKQLSSSPIILLTANSPNSPALSYFYNAGNSYFNVISSDSNDCSFFSWLVAKY